MGACPYIGFLEEDMADMIHKGFWIVLLYEQVAARKDIANLCISPMGVVPQRERRLRTIIDYSFSGVNQETNKQAPNKAMQFGRALDRVLHQIHTAPPHRGPVFLDKVNFPDGFYRVHLHADISKMAVAFPTLPGEPRLLAFPLVLPMGWTESPLHFCAVTKTVVDLANVYAYSNWDPPPHPLEHLAALAIDQESGTRRIFVPPPATQPTAHHVQDVLPTSYHGRTYRGRQARQDTRYVDVYMDNELLVAQGSIGQLNCFKQQLLHLNNQVLCPNDTLDTHQKKTISKKKLRKGDATWSTRKVALG